MKHIDCPYCGKSTRPDILHCGWCLKNLPLTLIAEGMKCEWTPGSREWHDERSQFEREVVCKCGGSSRARALVGNDAGAPETAGSTPATLAQMVQLCAANHTPEELALGWLRYECVRKMNARQFGEMCKRNLGGVWFDDLVTAALLEWKAPNDSSSARVRAKEDSK